MSDKLINGTSACCPPLQLLHKCFQVCKQLYRLEIQVWLLVVEGLALTEAGTEFGVGLLEQVGQMVWAGVAGGQEQVLVP